MNNFDFTDLILLVGTNPLPNYVVGKWFIQENKGLERIWLVYTGQTKRYAENLEKEFKKSNVTIEKKSLSNEASSFTIRKEFKEGVLSNLKGRTIHLNYTGGTKTMSVQTYISTLKETESGENELGIKATYSYLNARRFNIYQDDKENPISGDLRKEIDLDLENLLNLHGYKKVNGEDKYKASLNETVKALMSIDNIENIKFPEESIRNPKNYKYLLERKNDLSDGHIFNAEQRKLLGKLPSNLAVYSPDGIAKRSLNDENIKYAIEFLGGKWLELLVEEIVSHVKIPILVLNSKKLNTGWEIRDPNEWSKARNKFNQFMIKFELDVLLLYGYQFFGISCTTSKDRSLCKSKGFEILHRAKQIGGDEAKAILISFLPNLPAKDGDEITPKDLQLELETDTGNTGDILVLGSDDLKPNILANKIEEFINK